MSTIEVEPVVPPESMIPPIQSSTKFILNRQRGEFITPIYQYSYNNYSQIILNVNSPTSFVDFSNSYIRMYFQAQGTCGTATSANGGIINDPDIQMYLAEGGANSLFRNITVSTVNGTELSRIPNANRLNAMFRNATKSPEYIDRCLWKEGDSFRCTPEMKYITKYLWQGTAGAKSRFAVDWGTTQLHANLADGANTAQIDFDVTAIAQTNATAQGYRDLQVGDRLRMSNGTVTLSGTISAVPTAADVSNVTLLLDCPLGALVAAVDFTEANVSLFQVERLVYEFPMRNAVCALTNGSAKNRVNGTTWSAIGSSGPTVDTTFTTNQNCGSFGTTFSYTAKNSANYSFSPTLGGFELCVQPFHPILMSNVWIPLFLIRGGLQITIDLDRPDFAFVTNNAGYINNWNYILSNVQYVCDMIQPEQSLTDTYIDLYRADRLNYHFMGFINQQDVQNSGSLGTWTNRLTPAVRSARHYICQIQDGRCYQEVGTGQYDLGLDAAYVDSLAQGLYSGINQFNVDIGTERFPLNRPIVLDDNGAADSFNSLSEIAVFRELSLTHYGDTNMTNCLDQYNSSPPFSWENGPYLWQIRQRGINPNCVTPAITANTMNTADAANLYPGLSGTSNTAIAAGKCETTRFYIAVPLTRHVTPFSGINVKDNAVQVNFNFNRKHVLYTWKGAEKPDNRYFNQYVSYDSIISIGEQGLIQRR